MSDLSRALVAEALGTAFLLAIVVGSGIMAERLAMGNTAIALLANSLATGLGLAAMIHALAPISGAHFNPLVSAVLALLSDLPARHAAAYAVVQVLAAFAGVAIAHAMFGEACFTASTKIRTGFPQWLAEFVATFGLIVVILACRAQRTAAAGAIVAAYVASAYWFTSSTSFANPAVTLARAATNTFAGIRPDDLAGFVASQALGALTAWALMRWLARS